MRLKFSITVVIFLLVGMTGNALCAQNDATEEFIEFMNAEAVKDDEIRAATEDQGKGLELAKELSSARASGLEFANVLLNLLESADVEAFPGIAALHEDLKEKGVLPETGDHVDQWKDLDVEALTINNPNFWKAYYEVAPGQGVMEALYASLLKTNGQCMKSLQVSVIARLGQRKKEGSLTSFHMSNAMRNQVVFDASYFLINQGIKDFEKKEYEKAKSVFREILDQWPQCGLASFELGLTLHFQKEHKAGREVKTQGVKKGDPAAPTQETYELYETARTHDPMIRNAYQGEGQTQRLVLMAKIVLPAYRSLSNLSSKKVDSKQLGRFGAGSQAVGLHDYALFSRQVFIASKDKFDAPDLKFIKSSLLDLIGEDSAAEVIESLSKKRVPQFSLNLKPKSNSKE